MDKYAKRAIFAGAAAAVAVSTFLSAAAKERRRKKLAGQVVLISGGSRGFGLALARKLAELDCRVALCARDRAELERALHSLKPGDHEVFVCDISNQDEVTQMVGAVADRYSKIDILLNNAGEIMVSPFENLKTGDFERAMAVMFWGNVYASLAVLPLMKARGQGRIANVTSIGGKVSVPHLLSYSCAKAAAVAFSDGLRNEVAQFGIEVTTIVPGLMRTGSHLNAWFKGKQVAEASWFGAAASLPVLSLSAEDAARGAIDAIAAGKAEIVLGLPAQILSTSKTLLPGLISEVLRFANALLPKGNADDSIQKGRELDDRHGSIYRLLTILGKQAGKRLNQPV